MDENMCRFGRRVAGPPNAADHPLDKTVALPQPLKLLVCQLQSRMLYQNGEALG